MRRFLFSFLVSLLLLGSVQVVAANPAIKSMEAQEAGGMIAVRFDLTNASARQDIITSLQSGLPTAFTYEIQLIRKRPNWFDEGVAEARLEMICTFNSLTQEYLLNYRRDRRLVRSEVLRDLPTLMKKMTSISEERLFSTGRYRPQKLVVRARASLTQGYLLHVVPWQETTSWKQVRVRSEER